MKSKKIRIKRKDNNWKKIIFLVLTIVVLVLIFFISKKLFKNNKSGDNMNSQEIVDYILNINSYKAKIYVEVTSNKNSNKYVINQEYNTENGDVEEIIEPSNISGVKIIKQNNTLKLENSNLNLDTVFENYNELGENCLDLSSFIKDYRDSSKSGFTEKNNQIIMNTENNEKIYNKNKSLYIDRSTLLPVKLIIKDNNQKTTINIQYNEIVFN